MNSISDHARWLALGEEAGVGFLEGPSLSVVSDTFRSPIKGYNYEQIVLQNNKEQGMWAGECYEQGVMNELLKNKYKNNVYIDYNSLFYNKIHYNKNFDYSNKKLFFLHLAGHSSSQRNNIMVNLWIII